MTTAPNTHSLFHDAPWADPALVSLREVTAHVVRVLAPHSSAVSLRSRLYGAVFLKWLCDQGATEERSLAVPGLSWRGFLQRARENKLYEALRELGPDYKDLLTSAFFLRTETIVDPSLVQCLSELSSLDLGPSTDMAPVLHVLHEALSVSERMPEHGRDRDTPPGVARLLTELLEAAAKMYEMLNRQRS